MLRKSKVALSTCLAQQTMQCWVHVLSLIP